MEQLLDDAARRLRASIEPLMPTIEPEITHSKIDDALTRLGEALHPHLERVVVSWRLACFSPRMRESR